MIFKEKRLDYIGRELHGQVSQAVNLVVAVMEQAIFLILVLMDSFRLISLKSIIWLDCLIQKYPKWYWM